jgi:hypothetical protein
MPRALSTTPAAGALSPSVVTPNLARPDLYSVTDRGCQQRVAPSFDGSHPLGDPGAHTLGAGALSWLEQASGIKTTMASRVRTGIRR